jgi:hypothetical protein
MGDCDQNRMLDTLASEGEKMAAVFGVGTAMAFIWAAAKYQMVYGSVVDSLPPQLLSRYAFPAYALSPSTPLALQAEYVNSLWGMSVAFLCVSLCFFSLQEIGAGCAAFGVFCWSVIYSVKARKSYTENCSQALAQDQREKARRHESGA